MPQLTTLILSHNRIDGLLKDGIGENKRLKKLDISNNQFSWKPTVFKEQLDMLASGACHDNPSKYYKLIYRRLNVQIQIVSL
eukprot:3834397-Amphidinium_carterae.1